jgi:prophage regulatory protein
VTTQRKVGTDLPHAPASRMARLPQVIEMVGLSRTTILRLVHEGRFPSPIKVGMRAIAWRLSDLETYLAERPKTHPCLSNPQEAAAGDRQEG